MKIGFLFNHEQLHQIPHAIPVAFELSRMADDVDVSIITSSSKQLNYIKQFESEFPGLRCEYIDISLPTIIRILGRLIDKALPFTKVIMMRMNLDVFRELDVLVAPEKTSLLLKTKFGLEHIKFIFTAHGSGDRKFGFNKEFGKFDLVFVSGPKTQIRMKHEGVLDNAESVIVGYPKFDAVGAYTKPPKRLFGNDKPVVLYNPHFSPNVSSWYEMGMDILEYFYKSDKYNLIFAPHVMLYTRKMHISQETMTPGWVKRIPNKYRTCDHILIDTDSIACNDMTYTLSADIYVGDVSSQFHEFLIRPRPCLFANAHHVEWENDPSYINWKTGIVFDHVSQIDDCLTQAITTHVDYIPYQKELFESTFEITDTPSSVRAARAILNYMKKQA
jgi:hypothetical protein